ncbi:MAG: OmpH family outer membrane protein [Chitinophagaceae bacterium]|nr:OmpH family outer membrane protein [Chitinophagaceae bacterium]
MRKNIKNKVLLLASIAIISINSSCTQQDTKPTATANTTSVAGKIAYINVDTLQEKYGFWKTQADAIEAEQAKIESELQRSAQQLQNDIAVFQQKAQNGTLSEAEGSAAQKRLGQMQQSLETRRTTLGEQLQAKQMAFSEQLQKNIDEYLAIYNKDNKYDYIMSYTKSGQILYANKALDITEDVLKGLNDFKPTTEAATK